MNRRLQGGKPARGGRDPDLPLVIVSGAIGETSAVEMMKAGAHDYLRKDQLSRLVPVVERELREAKMRREARQVGRPISCSIVPACAASSSRRDRGL